MFAEEENRVAYCTDLGQFDIEDVLHVILKPAHKNAMPSYLFNITQDRFLMCTSPFSSKLERNMVQNSTELDTDMSILAKRFREARKVTILKAGSKTVLLNQAEQIVMAESKVKRNIILKKTELRRVDCYWLVKLLEIYVLNFNSQNPAAYQSKKSENLIGYRSSVTRIQQRQVQRGDATESVIPQHKVKFSNPSHPTQGEDNDEDKSPIQATGIDTDSLSMQMAINAPSIFNSQGEASVPSGISYRSGSASTHDVYAPSLRSSLRENGAGVSNLFIPALPRYPDFMTPEKRLATFQAPSWQINEKPDIADLVELGFFFTDRGDLVRCFMCGIGLKDWVKNDDVLREHVKHSSKCAFLLQKFGQREVDRFLVEISSGNQSVSGGSQSFYRMRSPQYQTMEARLATFKSFPGNIAIPHQQLAVAGLYFTGQGDLCRCFTCDGGLKDWSDGDDPCKEHATYFSNCEYITQLKGKEYVRALQQRRQNSQPMGATGGNSQPVQDTEAATLLSMDRLNIATSDHSRSPVSQFVELGYSGYEVEKAMSELQKRGEINPSTHKIVNMILDLQNGERKCTTENDSEDLQAIVEENERLTQMVQCMLCINEEPDVLFLPCAHHRICHRCAENITYCPVCNTFIKDKVRTYRA